MQVLRLGPGDEDLATQACRALDVEGDVHPSVLLSRREALLLVACGEDGEVAGWAYGHELVHPDGERTMLLYAVQVRRTIQGHGVGRALVSSFVSDAQSRGCTEVWVLTDDENAAALATYTSAGGRRDPVQQVMFTWRLAQGRHS
jgi:ribosomal protein S18 acetylase RimI-like enzyme